MEETDVGDDEEPGSGPGDRSPDHRTAARLRISVGDGLARIEVTDDGQGDPMLRDPGPEGGYGLWLTDILAQSWGVTSAHGKAGKTAWFTIPLAEPRG